MTDRRDGQVASIRDQLQLRRLYLDDTDLRAEVDEWIEASFQETDADTAREYVEQRLNQLLANHPMYHAPRLERGEDGFPDDCSECEHYGAACPVLRDEVEVRWRERKLAEADTDADARAIYQQQAIDTGCERIPEFLEAWDSQHADHARRGQDLLARVERAIATDEVAPDDDEDADAIEPVIGVGGDAGGE